MRPLRGSRPGPISIRTALFILAFLPFLYLAIKDGLFHFRGRKVQLAEHLLHLAITMLLASIFVQALLGRYPTLLAVMALFVILGGIDEFLFHRRLPADESDLHAKGHLALVIFLVFVASYDWLAAHDWRVDTLLPPRGAVEFHSTRIA